jgi:hypothetical protein
MECHSSFKIKEKCLAAHNLGILVILLVPLGDAGKFSTILGPKN